MGDGRPGDVWLAPDRPGDLGQTPERVAAVARRRRLHRPADDAAIEVGRFTSWIAPPKVGIDNKPGDFEYVQIAA